MRDFRGNICYFDRPSAHWRTTLQQGLGGHWQTYWRMTTASTGSGWRQLIVWPRSTSKNLLSSTLPFFEESKTCSPQKEKNPRKPMPVQFCTSLSFCLKILNKFWIYKIFYEKSNRNCKNIWTSLSCVYYEPINCVYFMFSQIRISYFLLIQRKQCSFILFIYNPLCHILFHIIGGE